MCNMDKTKSGRYGAAGTYTPYFGVLCTAASNIAAKQMFHLLLAGPRWFIHIAQDISVKNEFRNHLCDFIVTEKLLKNP